MCKLYRNIPITFKWVEINRKKMIQYVNCDYNRFCDYQQLYFLSSFLYFPFYPFNMFYHYNKIKAY